MSPRTAGLFLAMAILAMAPAGCRSAAPSPYSTPSEVSRSTVEAEVLSRKGADLVEEDPARAEAILCEALSKDLYFGPAHNNLGVLYLKQQKLYEAANEFECSLRALDDQPIADSQAHMTHQFVAERKTLALERRDRHRESTRCERRSDQLAAKNSAASLRVSTYGLGSD